VPLKNANPRAGDAGAGTLQASTADTNNQITPAKQERPSFLVTLQPLPGSTDPTQQVWRLLKHALRYYGLRCTSIEEAPR
jgi:hypothetical protein